MKYYIYILQTEDRTYYTGLTKDLDARIALHNQGRGARYTRGRLPVKLIYYEEAKDFKSATQREIKIKSLSRREKEGLITKFRRYQNLDKSHNG